jgi:hypothetical protein
MDLAIAALLRLTLVQGVRVIVDPVLSPCSYMSYLGAMELLYGRTKYVLLA